VGDMWEHFAIFYRFGEGGDIIFNSHSSLMCITTENMPLCFAFSCGLKDFRATHAPCNTNRVFWNHPRNSFFGNLAGV